MITVKAQIINDSITKLVESYLQKKLEVNWLELEGNYPEANRQEENTAHFAQKILDQILTELGAI